MRVIYVTSRERERELKSRIVWRALKDAQFFRHQFPISGIFQMHICLFRKNLRIPVTVCHNGAAPTSSKNRSDVSATILHCHFRSVLVVFLNRYCVTSSANILVTRAAALSNQRLPCASRVIRTCDCIGGAWRHRHHYHHPFALCPWTPSIFTNTWLRESYIHMIIFSTIIIAIIIVIIATVLLLLLMIN